MSSAALDDGSGALEDASSALPLGPLDVSIPLEEWVTPDEPSSTALDEGSWPPDDEPSALLLGGGSEELRSYPDELLS